MKPLVLKAQAKELYEHFKNVEEMTAKQLIEANTKILKMQLEIQENLKILV